MIYRVIIDFIDIYEMSELLALGAKTCTRVITPTTLPQAHHNLSQPLFNCTESKFFELMKESRIETIIQFLCSFSFLIFFLVYYEAIGKVESRINEEKRKTLH